MRVLARPYRPGQPCAYFERPTASRASLSLMMDSIRTIFFPRNVKKEGLVVYCDELQAFATTSPTDTSLSVTPGLSSMF
jgi:hypothetical protein